MLLFLKDTSDHGLADGAGFVLPLLNSDILNLSIILEESLGSFNLTMFGLTEML